MLFKGFNLRPLVLLLYLFFILFCSSTGLTSVAESTVIPDVYEEDDNFSNATYFLLNDNSQQHNSHDAGDVDWIKFYAIPGEEHIIRVTNAEANCNVYIELYDTDGVTLIKRVNEWIEGPEGTDELLLWILEDGGIYFAKIAQASPEAYGDGTGYELSVALCSPAIGFGTVCGFISDPSTGIGIDGAKISSSNFINAESEEGYYCMVHIVGDFELTVNVSGYPTQTKNFTVVNGGMEEVNFNFNSNSNPSSLCFLEDLFGLDSREIEVLRNFRDGVLEKNIIGRGIIKQYYELNPKLLELVEENKVMKRNIKHIISGMIPVVEKNLNNHKKP